MIIAMQELVLHVNETVKACWWRNVVELLQYYSFI